MSWINADGLRVKFGREEADVVPGKHTAGHDGGLHVVEFDIDYTEVQSTSNVVLGSVAGDSGGVRVPEGAVPVQLELIAETAFTSSGTIGTSTLVIGFLKASDYSTALDVDDLTTTSFVMGVLDATGEDVIVNVGTTGAGDGYGVALTEPGVICVANSQHASHPFTAGKARCRLWYIFN